MLNDVDWYARNSIRLHLGKKVVRIDRRGGGWSRRTRPRTTTIALATGSNFHPSGAGKDLEGVSPTATSGYDAMIRRRSTATQW
jgi:nitrite reductase (NADH) large subunit